MSALCRAVAPLPIRVHFEPTTQRYELHWDGPHGPEHVGADDLDSAARAAYARLASARAPVTEPAGDTSFAEAMRELIECTAPHPRPPSRQRPSARPGERAAPGTRPPLRLVR